MRRAEAAARAGEPGASGDLAYVGRDLEAMSFAENYHRWILDEFAPFLGRRVVEVGAGSGTFSELLLQHQLEALGVVEPSRDMYRLLEQRLRDLNGTRIEAHNATFGEVAEHLRASVAPDSIVYVNVLEHIPDDLAELAAVHRTLAPGGRVFVFVPAFRWLYGPVDAEVGHYRRYTRRELVEKCERAGFRVLRARYFDFPGVAPWWLKYRLLKSSAMEPSAVRLYDRYVVPAARAIETRFAPPVGKNVLVVAER